VSKQPTGEARRLIVRPRGVWVVVCLSPFLLALAVVFRDVVPLVGPCVAVLMLRQRLVADEWGVTVINLVRVFRIPWREVSDFRMGRVGPYYRCLGVYRRDGRRVNAWVVDTGRIISELRRRQAAANGESLEAANARALENALTAARNGDMAPVNDLLMEERVDPMLIMNGLDELADQGLLPTHRR
jgi:hypothetical protein